ncbi:MAG: molecular chaperone TorD family protein [Actinobacteria bacterium]|nr:molecular chaperone TorD family protein [Actinomycetota bacterium]
MDSQELAMQAKAESTILGFWAKGFSRPTVEHAEELRTGAFASDLRNLLSACSDPTIDSAVESLEEFSNELAQKDIEKARLTLEVDYNRLFVGPSALLAPPYESFYKSTDLGEDGRGMLRGPAEREVKAEYLAHGLTMPIEFVEFPDHVAIELEYLSLLAAQEAEAWERDDREIALQLQEDQERFREEHLGGWFERFAQNVIDGAKTRFYPALASLVYRTAF